MASLISLAAARTFVIDAGERAGKTFLQGAAGATAPILLAAKSQHALTLAWWQLLIAVAVAGGLAAVGSLLTSLLAGFRTGSASLSSRVAQTAVTPGAHASDTPVTVAAQPAPGGFAGFTVAAADPPGLPPVVTVALDGQPPIELASS